MCPRDASDGVILSEERSDESKDLLFLRFGISTHGPHNAAQARAGSESWTAMWDAT